MPWEKVPDVEANNNTEPRSGPTQGDQPRAKTTPIRNELTDETLLNNREAIIFCSIFNHEIFNNPTKKRPKRTIKIPPILGSQILIKDNWPINEKAVPKSIKTNENPRT